MNEIQKFKSLKDQFDEIDRRVYDQVYDGYYESRFKIIMGMWEKGEAIEGDCFRGVKQSPSYREIARQTERNNPDIKKWHDLYLKYPNKSEYEEIAVQKARDWTDKVFKKFSGKKELTEVADFPEDKFRVIYADPPWQYGDKLIEGYGAAEHHYPAMNIEELCLLKIDELAAKDSVLFLWVTSPILDECFEIIKAWGFEYKTSFVWDKVKHNYGHYNSVRHEFLLICTKGSCLPEIKKLFDSVVSLERTAKHSEKPEKFRKMIDELYPAGKRIELFARKIVEGWERWGDETK